LSLLLFLFQCAGVQHFALTFSPAAAGALVTVKANVSIDTSLDPGNMLIMHLPGFTGAAFSNQSVGITNFWAVSWKPANSDLSLTSKSYLPAYTMICIVLSATWGLTLPSTGLYSNDTRLTIRGYTTTGIIPATPVTCSSSVPGTFPSFG